jgi:alkanesulfonate monooxygenase SsuD/methylene tetrahydromethanopterin reductase-like flavin-dependent oxidoreductase (luciferase family)
MRFGVFVELQLPRPWDVTSERQLYMEALEQIELADRLGFDYAWLVEHHFLEEYSHSSAPEVVLAAASQRTKDIRLGHGVLQVCSAVNHPVRIAERIAALDVISGGRVDIGTGAPSSNVELGGFGVSRAETRAMSEDGIDAVTRMFTEEPFAGWDSPYLKMPPRNVLPKPVQKPHPPLWVACGRRETINYAARRGVGALSFAFLEPEFAARLVADYNRTLLSDECVPAGFAVNPNFAVVLPMHCHADERTALRLHLDGAQFFEFSQEHYYKPKRHYPGRTNIYGAFKKQYGDGSADRGRPGGDLESGLFTRGAIGSPRQLASLIDRYEQVGVDQLIFLMQAGPTKHEAICESLELFGRQVLPQFAEKRAEQDKVKADHFGPAIEKALSRRSGARKPRPDYYID